MQYTLVYRDDLNGYNWTVMNAHGLYAASEWAGGRKSIRRWRNSDGAHEYMTEHRHRNAPEDLVWAPWPDEKPTLIKPVTTAASYKPAHRGYPDSAAAPVQPLVWPVIPQVDDGSNEEPTTVPDAVVAELSKRHYILVISR